METREQTQLYSTLRSEMNRHLQVARELAGEGVLSFLPSMSGEVCRSLYGNLTDGGFCTHMVDGTETWNPDDICFEAARDASRRGRNIERAFLLPFRSLRNNPLLNRHLALDNAAGITTHVLYVGDLLSSLRAEFFDNLEIGLWDGQVFCTGLSQIAHPAMRTQEVRVSRREDDLALARSFIETLNSKAERIVVDEREEDAEGDKSSFHLRALLVRTAPVADFLSTFTCRGDYSSSEGCRWYHSVWQYLRVLNIVSGPSWYADFYERALREAAKSAESNRVLISGSADYSVLAFLIGAYRLENKTVEPTVVDVCETPLLMCRWYAKNASVEIEAVATDVLSLQNHTPFDVIVTDAFLTQFSPDVRLDIVGKWASLLRPGGRVITTMRIKYNQPSGQSRQGSAQISTFMNIVRNEARHWYIHLNISPDDLAEKAQKYLDSINIFTFSSEEEIRRLFEGNRFKLTEFQLTKFPATDSAFAKVVAERV